MFNLIKIILIMQWLMAAQGNLLSTGDTKRITVKGLKS